MTPALAFRSTAELVADPEVRPLVDRLAAAARIESEAVGAAGAPSPTFKDYETLVGRATREQLLALLFHTSPVVRGYVAMHVVDHFAPDAAAVYPLLRDATPVERVEGCTIFGTAVSDVVVEALGNLAVRAPPAADLLLRAANDRALGAAVRGRALTFAAPLRKAEARAAALAMLDENDHALLRDALMALGMVGAADVSERIAKYAADPESLVRAQVASTLGKLRAPQARDVLTTLVRDDDRYVRQSAARQYGALPDADPAVVRELLAQTERSRVGELTAEGLADARTPQALELLRGFLASQGGTNEMFNALDANPGPEVTAMMRALLASTDWFVRERAVMYLGKVGDAASVPAIRPLLSGETIGEREHAAQALAALGDREAIPALEGMLHYLTDRAAGQARRLHVEPRSVRVHLRWSDGTGAARATQLPAGGDVTAALFEVARTLLRGLHTRRSGVRNLGIEISALQPHADAQLAIFAPVGGRERRLDAAVDRVREQFGFRALVSGPSLELLERLPSDAYGFVLRTPCLTR